MSRKIRLTGLVLTAVILLAGLIAICGVSSQNIGPVKSPEIVGTSSDSVKLSWKRVGSSDGYFVYQKKGDKFKKIKTVKDPQKLGCTVKNLDDSTAYTFVVRKNLLKAKSSQRFRLAPYLKHKMLRLRLFRQMLSEFPGRQIQNAADTKFNMQSQKISAIKKVLTSKMQNRILPIFWNLKLMMNIMFAFVLMFILTSRKSPVSGARL